eukprot:COSAG05_NODE_1313_length_5213_cov_6.108135_4_plen_175_part_00
MRTSLAWLLRSAFKVDLWPRAILPDFTTSERRALRLSTALTFFFAGILQLPKPSTSEPHHEVSGVSTGTGANVVAAHSRRTRGTAAVWRCGLVRGIGRAAQPRAASAKRAMTRGTCNVVVPVGGRGGRGYKRVGRLGLTNCRREDCRSLGGNPRCSLQNREKLLEKNYSRNSYM